MLKNILITKNENVNTSKLIQIYENSDTVANFLANAERAGLFDEWSQTYIWYCLEHEKIIEECSTFEISLKVEENQEFNLDPKILVTEEEKKAYEKIDIKAKITGIEFNSSQVMYRQNTDYYKWKNLEEWMLFFIAIGKYSQKHDEMSIYVSYLSEIVPIPFVALGIVEEYINSVNHQKNHLVENLIASIRVEEIVAYQKGDKWVEAKVISYNSERVKLMVYDNIKYESDILASDFFERVRLNANYKRNRGATLQLNDELNSKFYRDEIVTYLKATNLLLVNIIGRGVETSFSKIISSIKFKHYEKKFQLDDFLFFQSMGASYQNVAFIKSDVVVPKLSTETVSVFVGALNANNFATYLGKKNVILTSRMKINQEANDSQKNLLESRSIGTDLVKRNRDLAGYLSEQKITIPRGVELYVYK